MTGSTESYSPDEVVARGKALYEKDIRAQVETGNVGRLLLVDLTTGNWVMGEDRIEMARQLRARNPQAQNYGMRVGYPTTTAIGTSLRPLNEANPPHWRVREKLDDLWRVPAFRPPAGAVFRCLFPCDIFGIMRWSKNHAHQGGMEMTGGTQRNPLNRDSWDEVADRGKALYEQRLRAQVEEAKFGQYLILDVASGDYEIGPDHLETARRARAKHPEAALYGMRIGYPATDAIGATLRPIQEDKKA